MRLRDLLSKSCVPDMEGRPGAPSDPPPFPGTDRHLPQLEAAGPRPPGTMGRGFLQGLPQGGRQGQAGQRKAGTPLTRHQRRRRQGHAGPGPQLLTHCLSQGQVTSAGTFVSQGQSHATPTLKGSEVMPREREKEGRLRARDPFRKNVVSRPYEASCAQGSRAFGTSQLDLPTPCEVGTFHIPTSQMRKLKLEGSNNSPSHL